MSNPAPWAVLVLVGYALAFAISIWVAGDLDDAFGVAQALITGLVILGGAVYAVYRFQLYRELHPHLTISQEVTHRQISDDYLHVGVTATLKNSSRVKIEIREMDFKFLKLAPTTDTDAERLRDDVFVDGEEEIQWPVCYESKREWQENECVVEPGESMQATSEFIVSSTVRSALLYTYVHNSKFQKGSTAVKGWPASKFHDISQLTPADSGCGRGIDDNQ